MSYENEHDEQDGQLVCSHAHSLRTDIDQMG